MSAQGEDRSDFQAVLPPVDRTGKTLDFIWYKATEGTAWTSSTYGQNVALARQHNVPVGSYHFLHPSLDVDVQVAHFMSTVAAHGLHPGDMLAVDSEILSGVDGRVVLLSDRSSLLVRDPDTSFGFIRPGVSYPHHPLARSTPAAVSAPMVDLATRQFLSGVETAVQVALGGSYCPIMVYSFLNMLPQLASNTEYPLWVAYYDFGSPVSVGPWSKWTMWQYAGGGGNGGSDQDGFNGDAAQFNAWRLAKMPSPKPTPPPIPSTSSSVTATLPNLDIGDVDNPGQVEFVHRLQVLLGGLGTILGIPQCAGLKADGQFGPQTEAGVKAIQVFAHIARDMASASGKVSAPEWQFLITGTRGSA